MVLRPKKKQYNSTKTQKQNQQPKSTLLFSGLSLICCDSVFYIILHRLPVSFTEGFGGCCNACNAVDFSRSNSRVNKFHHFLFYSRNLHLTPLSLPRN